MPTSTSERTRVYSVLQLNHMAKSLLETHLSRVSVRGEISNFVCASSGHSYFTLKDASAQVSCAMFRGQGRKLNFTPQDGLQVQVTARVTLYEPRGNYQLVIERMAVAGDGALKQAFEALKAKLQAEGLFEQRHKKTLPSHPERIGVITSATGAAIKDIIHVFKRRNPLAHLIIYPCLVQGSQASQAIAQQIALANQRAEVDCLIVGRGGGSLEDLFAFNEETVARAIFHSELPIVSAVGHEIDITIADLVADYRAATPTAAAEILSPDWRTWWLSFCQRYTFLVKLTTQYLSRISEKLLYLEKRLQHPGDKLARHSQRLDELEHRLKQVMHHRQQQRLFALHHLQQQLQQHSPAHRIAAGKLTLDFQTNQLHRSITQLLQRKKQQLSLASGALSVVSPLSTLERGYAIVEHGQRVVRDVTQLKPHDTVQVRLHKGSIECEVRTIKE